MTCIVGFRSVDLIFWTEKLAQFSDELILCTDDGSAGRPGYVDAALRDLLARDPAQLVVAIGPMPMMHACAEASRPFGVRTMVSLNTNMVDGTGMCGSCRVTVGGEVKFACVDGPDFDAHAVDFKELHARQKRFQRQEQQANEDHAHVCTLEQLLVVEGKRTYKKYLALERVQVKMPERNAAERSANFEEVNLGYGPTETPLLFAVPDKVLDAFRKAIPMRRFAQPSEVADAILFFASGRSGYVTGQVMSVSGGLTMAG